MSDRATGATAAQIKAAAKRGYDQKCPDFAWEYRTEEYRASWRAFVELGARNLVPPGYAIVRRDDLRAVLGYVPEEAFDVDDLAVDMAAVGLREVLGE